VTHNVKRRKLDFSNLPHSALKFQRKVTYCACFLDQWHSAHINELRSVAFRVQFASVMPHIGCFRSQIDSECHRPNRRFRPVAFRFQACCGMPQSALHIWARNAVLEWNPAPAIIHTYVADCFLGLYYTGTPMVSVYTRFSCSVSLTKANPVLFDLIYYRVRCKFHNYAVLGLKFRSVVLVWLKTVSLIFL
jgi:hypothetical protein